MAPSQQDVRRNGAGSVILRFFGSSQDSTGVAATDPTHLSASKPFETEMFDFSEATRLTEGDARLSIAFSRQS